MELAKHRLEAALAASDAERAALRVKVDNHAAVAAEVGGLLRSREARIEELEEVPVQYLCNSCAVVLQYVWA